MLQIKMFRGQVSEVEKEINVWLISGNWGDLVSEMQSIFPDSTEILISIIFRTK